MNRRHFLQAVPVGGGVAALSGSVAVQPDLSASRAARQAVRLRRLPDVALRTHDDRRVRVHELVVGRKVVVNFMYTVCGNICTPATRNLLEARRLLGGFADDVHFLSISLTPLQDDPPALRAYRASFGIGPGWTFLTGQPADVEAVQRGLGLQGDDPADLDSHAGMARVVDEARGRWGHVSVLATPRGIARMIRAELG